MSRSNIQEAKFRTTYGSSQAWCCSCHALLLLKTYKRAEAPHAMLLSIPRLLNYVKCNKQTWIRRRWPEKVDRLAARLCSSPMSASTFENDGSRTGAAAGTASPAFAISTASPNACTQPVLTIAQQIKSSLVRGLAHADNKT